MRARARRPRALLLVAVLAAGACGRQSHMPEANRSEAAQAIDDVTPAQWETLAGRRIFFGHQSVGGNIIDGVTAVLRDHAEIPLRVEETAEPKRDGGPGLFHARIGMNGTPMSKVDAFDQLMAEGSFDAASLKFCYVDVSADTDPESLFAEYQRRMDEVRERDPSLVLIHMTMPLTTIEGRWQSLKARLRGRTTYHRNLNAIRNRYNALLRDAYLGHEPVFDVAEVESTLPDGTRSSFRRDGQDVYVLHPGYTTDGGHLNELGQRRVAEAFLAFLAKLD